MTPLEIGRKTYAELHTSRQFRTDLINVPKQSSINWEQERQLQERTRKIQKEKYDIGSRQLWQIKEGARIFFRHLGKWKTGKIIKILANPRSYLIQSDETGRLISRNRRDLNENFTNEKIVKIPSNNFTVSRAAEWLDRERPRCQFRRTFTVSTTNTGDGGATPDPRGGPGGATTTNQILPGAPVPVRRTQRQQKPSDKMKDNPYWDKLKSK